MERVFFFCNCLQASKAKHFTSPPNLTPTTKTLQSAQNKLLQPKLWRHCQNSELKLVCLTDVSSSCPCCVGWLQNTQMYFFVFSFQTATVSVINITISGSGIIRLNFKTRCLLEECIYILSS